MNLKIQNNFQRISEDIYVETWDNQEFEVFNHEVSLGKFKVFNDEELNEKVYQILQENELTGIIKSLGESVNKNIENMGYNEEEGVFRITFKEKKKRLTQVEKLKEEIKQLKGEI